MTQPLDDRTYADMAAEGSAPDYRDDDEIADDRCFAATELLAAFRTFVDATTEATALLPRGDRRRFDAYLGRVIDPEDRVLGGKSIQEWVADLAAQLDPSRFALAQVLADPEHVDYPRNPESARADLHSY